MGNEKKKQTPPTPPQPEETPPVTPLVDALGELFEKHGVKLAVAAFELPNSAGPAHVFYVGHFYDVAKMSAMINRQFVDQVRKELG